ncbi:MAG TPA: SgcJ/EcaC family oxidoreductase [Thermoanaerobaculia bacterium]|nr:SgcJ/EcaC family oxidoreductase [Thermoanaerobaculia bacterium]
MRLRFVSLFLLFCAALSLRAAETGEADAVLSRYADAYNRQDAAALASLYAEDGLLLPPDGALVRGRKAIEEFRKKHMGMGLTLKTLERNVGTDIAYLAGNYSFPGEPDAGKSLLCLKRGKTGGWQIGADMWNRNGAGAYVPAQDRQRE